MIWFLLIFFVLYGWCWFAVTRYDVQMFQQNSYRLGRYLSWLRNGNRLAHRRAWMVLLPLLGIDRRGVWAAALLMAWLTWKELSTVYKKPVVFTARVLRLYVTCGLLTLVVLLLAGWLWPAGLFVTAGLTLLLSNFMVLLANTVNIPLEKAISRWYYNDARKRLRAMPDLLVIGITGSYGKTSTKHFLYRILSEKYNVLMTPGNFNTTLGVVRTVREHLQPYHQVFIVEMGAKQSGDIREICDLVHPRIGIITSVGEMHLDTFKTLDNIRRTKFELIESLPADGLGVVNLDSEAAAAYRPQWPGHLAGYGIAAEKTAYGAVDVRYGVSGTTFGVRTPEGFRTGYETKLVGEGNLLNILAGIVVADHLGIPEKKQKIAVAQLQSVEHRLSRRTTSGRITILDDAYNSNPQGARMALAVLRDFRTEPDGRRIVVTPGFIELGARQAELNRELGREMAAACDHAIVVNATNRDAIARGLADGGFPEERIFRADTFAQASAHLSEYLHAGDVVLYENDLPDSFK